MLGLLGFHEIAARRGDGLRPEFFGRLLIRHDLKGRHSFHVGGWRLISRRVLPMQAASRRLLASRR
jgi:hypothetical protein